MPEPIPWRTSSYSANTGTACVEVGPLPDGTGRVAVRHSKQQRDTVIIYTREEWAAFVAGATDGEFNF